MISDLGTWGTVSANVTDKGRRGPRQVGLGKT